MTMDRKTARLNAHSCWHSPNFIKASYFLGGFVSALLVLNFLVGWRQVMQMTGGFEPEANFFEIDAHTDNNATLTIEQENIQIAEKQILMEQKNIQIEKQMDIPVNAVSISENTTEFPTMISNNESKPWKLRFDWTNLEMQSEIAKRIEINQQNCSLPYMEYHWRGDAGMGSDLHVFSNQLLAGVQDSHRVRIPDPWLWTDVEACSMYESTAYSGSQENASSWRCYFHNAEPLCPEEVLLPGLANAGACGRMPEWPPSYTTEAIRAGVTEFLFSKISPIVVKEAERQLVAVFGNNTKVPENLITVHIRWGDKVMEYSKLNNPVDDFVAAVHNITIEKKIDSVHVLLCTEDPVAEAAFREAADPSWSIYVDHFYTEFLAHRKDRSIEMNLPSLITKDLKGKPGLWALGSLLVAMESNYFVFTTKSNWARLMNELLKNVVAPRCDNCTYTVDIEEGEC